MWMKPIFLFHWKIQLLLCWCLPFLFVFSSVFLSVCAVTHQKNYTSIDVACTNEREPTCSDCIFFCSHDCFCMLLPFSLWVCPWAVAVRTIHLDTVRVRNLFFLSSHSHSLFLSGVFSFPDILEAQKKSHIKQCTLQLPQPFLSNIVNVFFCQCLSFSFHHLKVVMPAKKMSAFLVYHFRFLFPTPTRVHFCRKMLFPWNDSVDAFMRSMQYFPAINYCCWHLFVAGKKGKNYTFQWRIDAKWTRSVAIVVWMPTHADEKTKWECQRIKIIDSFCRRCSQINMSQCLTNMYE